MDLLLRSEVQVPVIGITRTLSALGITRASKGLTTGYTPSDQKDFTAASSPKEAEQANARRDDLPDVLLFQLHICSEADDLVEVKHNLVDY